jgi:Uma2 family endonuclease
MAKEHIPAPTLTKNSGAAVEDNENSIIMSKPERFTNATGAPVPDIAWVRQTRIPLRDFEQAWRV